MLQAMFANVSSRGQDMPTIVCMDANLQLASDATLLAFCAEGRWADAVQMQGRELVHQPAYSLSSVWDSSGRHNTRIDVILRNPAAQRLFRQFRYVKILPLSSIGSSFSHLVSKPSTMT